MLRWTGNTIVAFILVVMVVLVFFTVGARVTPDGLPKLADYKLMVVLSGSMSPVFEAGDVIVVSGTKSGKEYKKGDIITFKDPEEAARVVTHRVVEVLRDGDTVSYKTKGDANSTPDTSPVPSGHVIGRQELTIPYFGRVVEFSKTKQGLIWMIFMPGVFIIVSELRNITKAVANEVEKKKREAVSEQCSRD